MKKRFTVKFVVGLICMALMVSMLSFSGMTAGAEAEHPSHSHAWILVGIYESVGYVSIDDSQHGYLRLYEYMCGCGAMMYEPYYWNERNHSKVWHDLGHVPGTQTHERRVTCQACNYDTIETYYCPGPPCIQ